MVAVEAAHEMSARDVVTARAVEVQLRGAVEVVRRPRPHLVEVDLHIGVEGFDRGPGARADVVVAKAVDVDEIELRERRRVGGDERGGSAVIDEQRGDEFARAGGLGSNRQGSAQEKRKGGGAYCDSRAPATGGNRLYDVKIRKFHDGLGVVDSRQPVATS